MMTMMMIMMMIFYDDDDDDDYDDDDDENNYNGDINVDDDFYDDDGDDEYDDYDDYDDDDDGDYDDAGTNSNKGCSILVFTPEGKVRTKFGTRGQAPAQLAGPHYVAVNSHGNIIISDFHNHSIKAFTEEGLFLFSFGSNGKYVLTLVPVKES